MIVLTFLLVSFVCQIHGQNYVTNYPYVSNTNCNICRIAQVVVSDNHTKVLLEITGQRKNTKIFFTEWTVLLPYSSSTNLSELRNWDLDIPSPTSTNETYLNLWFRLAEKRKKMREETKKDMGNWLIRSLGNNTFNTNYNIKSKDGDVFGFLLYFNKLPPGVENIIIMELIENGWEFVGIKIKNPDNSPKTTWTEASIKTDWERNGITSLEGIYENTIADKNSPKYSLALKIDEASGELQLIYLSGLSNSLWKPGHIKATLSKTATPNFYKAKWYMSNKTVDEDLYISFEPGSMKVLWSDGKPEQLYIKLYPVVDDDFTSSHIGSTSGTGFAISENGYVITNQHVIDGANNVTIRGIKGNFSKTYTAEIIIEDKNNDLAILRVIDPSFTTLGTPPYKFLNTLSDVGTSVYALGYPLRATMGDEVKLTNGIISSKTGFQGDITSYQISVPVQPGNSGGPLLDSDGNVIGIITAKHIGAENASYAVKSNYLFNLMQVMNTMPQLPKYNSISDKTLSDQVKCVREFVYIIEAK